MRIPTRIWHAFDKSDPLLPYVYSDWSSRSRSLPRWTESFAILVSSGPDTSFIFLHTCVTGNHVGQDMYFEHLRGLKGGEDYLLLGDLTAKTASPQ